MRSIGCIGSKGKDGRARTHKALPGPASLPTGLPSGVNGFEVHPNLSRSEQFELAHQMRTAARSVPANIAEGWARREPAAEFRRFLQMAIGSCEEMRVRLDFSREEGYLDEKVVENLHTEYARIGVCTI